MSQPAGSSPRQKILDEFAIYLKEMRRRSGQPSYKELAKRTPLGVTTIENVFNGKCMPRWETVASIVRELDGADEAEARERWANVRKQLDELKCEGDTNPPVSHVRNEGTSGDSLQAPTNGSSHRVRRTTPILRTGLAVGLAVVAAICLIMLVVVWHPLERGNSGSAEPGPSSSPLTSPSSNMAQRGGASKGASTSGCREVYQYRVLGISNVTDERGQTFDELSEGDLFVRDPHADSKPLAGRYYGTANRRGIVGYVRIAHLRYERALEICS